MTTLIEKIQAEIDRAAEKCVDRDSLEIRDADREARAFKFGARSDTQESHVLKEHTNS